MPRELRELRCMLAGHLPPIMLQDCPEELPYMGCPRCGKSTKWYTLGETLGIRFTEIEPPKLPLWVE